MDKELIIRKLKENTKVIALGFVILISAIIIGVSISTLTKTDNTLYQESKDGIYIKEEFLVYNDTISIKVYAKTNDTIHIHFKTWDEPFHVEMMCRGTFWGEGVWDWQTERYDNVYNDCESGIIIVELTNNDHNEHINDDWVVNGSIEIFVIVWSENDYPYCPLC